MYRKILHGHAQSLPSVPGKTNATFKIAVSQNDVTEFTFHFYLVRSHIHFRQMKSGIITWVRTNSPTAPDALCDCKSCVCMPNWSNNLELVTSHPEIEGTAQCDYSQFHRPQLYLAWKPAPGKHLSLFWSKSCNHMRVSLQLTVHVRTSQS